MDMERKVLEQIEGILCAENMLECAEKLDEFVRFLSQDVPQDELELALAYFWHSLFEVSVISREFEDPENRGWQICPQEQAIATYMSTELMPRRTNEADLEYLAGYARQLREEFGVPTTCGTEAERIQSVMAYMDEQYDLSNRLFTRQKAAFILLPDICKAGMAATLFRYYSDANVSCPHFVFYGGNVISTLSDMLISPAFSIIHELARAIFVIACSREGNCAKGRAIPSEVLDILVSGGNSTLLEKEPESQIEIIIDAMADAIMADSPFKKLFLMMDMQREPEKFQSYRQALEVILDKLPLRQN